MKQEASFEKEPMKSLQEVLLPTYLQESVILDLLPAAVYVCDMSGVIKKYNEQAVKLLGRRPAAGDKDENFFSLFKFYRPDGSLLPHPETSIAGGQPQKNPEVIIERPDGSRTHVRVSVVPIKDEQGKQVGIINCFDDITEQKKTEKELDRKRRELQDYVDNAPIGLHWVDRHGIIKWANKAELDMLGYTDEEYIGHPISEFHLHAQKIADILKRLSRNETLHQYESEMRCKDGSIKTIHVSSNVLWEDGKFIHTRCFTVDVTAQKKLFNALRESEDRHRNLLQALPSAIYTCDADGYLTFYNNAAVQLWGREPQLGKDLWCGSWKINKPDGSPLALDTCPMAICLKEGRSVYGEEIIVVRPDGEQRYVMPHPQPLFDETGKLTGAVNMLMDVTELKETEQALRKSEWDYRQLAASLEKKVKEKVADLQTKNEALKRSEERYHKMVEEVEDYVIILLDANGIVQNWNKGAEKIKGYKEKEIVGKSFSTFYLPEDREKGLPDRLIKLARENGKAVHEGWRRRKDGTTFWGSTVLTALHDKENTVIGFSKVTRDLTERKVAEDKLKEYTSQLEFQNEQLEQFAYAASHDMKEPLRKILFYNNYLWDAAADHLEEKEKEYLNRSIKAAKRMQVLIDDLLSYSKASSDTGNFEPVNLNELMDELTFSFKEAIEEQQASIHYSSLPVVKGIPFQLRQLFDNLISNALKYHHPERRPEVSIAATMVDGSNIAGLEPQKEYHKIVVSDNGIGFEPQHAEKIFELFQRLPGTNKYSGTGVGLALCKKIVHNHQGAIKATAQPNEGAYFEIYLPA